MLSATFKGDSNELTGDFLERIKLMFKGKRIEVVVTESDETDETEYLLNDPVNRKQLLEAHGRVDRREGLIDVDINAL